MSKDLKKRLYVNVIEWKPHLYELIIIIKYACKYPLKKDKIENMQNEISFFILFRNFEMYSIQ